MSSKSLKLIVPAILASQLVTSNIYADGLSSGALTTTGVPGSAVVLSVEPLIQDFSVSSATNTNSSTINSLGSGGIGNITVTSTVGWPSQGQLGVDSEVMTFNVVDSVTLDITSRGIWGSSTATHSNGSTLFYAIFSNAANSSSTPSIVLWSGSNAAQPLLSIGQGPVVQNGFSISANQWINSSEGFLIGGNTALQVNGGAGTLSVGSTSFNTNILGGQTYTSRVATASGSVAVAKTDYMIIVNKGTGAATTVNLPSSPLQGLTFCVKDGKGDANTNNITITPAAGNIDGSSTDVINTAYGSACVLYNGTQWNVISSNSGLL